MHYSQNSYFESVGYFLTTEHFFGGERALATVQSVITFTGTLLGKYIVNKIF